jgi:hypothetical protein
LLLAHLSLSLSLCLLHTLNDSLNTLFVSTEFTFVLGSEVSSMGGSIALGLG